MCEWGWQHLPLCCLWLVRSVWWGVGPEGERALIEWGPWWDRGGGGRDIKGSAPLLGGVRRVQRKRRRAGQSGKKRKYIRGNREDDWLLRRSRVLPFWRSPYTPPRKVLWRDGHEFDSLESGGLAALKIHQWDNRMPFGHGHTTGSLWFSAFVCEVDITSRLTNETPRGPYQEER